MKVTAITVQKNNSNRANIYIDGRYSFSLDIFQIATHKVSIGKEYTDKQVNTLLGESDFGKLYIRALEYTALRPHSAREVRDYLYKKTRNTKVICKKTRELVARKGVSKDIADRVYDRLVEKGYIDDAKFAEWWIENRSIQKGTSMRKMYSELHSKGVEAHIINEIMQKSTRDEKSEIIKIISRKYQKYNDTQKLVAYLVRQGFSYDDARETVSEYSKSEDSLPH